LLASLKERSTCRKLSCFFEVGDRDSLKNNDLANEADKNIFALLWEAMALPAVEAFSYFWE